MLCFLDTTVPPWTLDFKMKRYRVTCTAFDGSNRVQWETAESLGEAFQKSYATLDEAFEVANELQSQAKDDAMEDPRFRGVRYNVDED
jgi:hypothetical protein